MVQKIDGVAAHQQALHRFLRRSEVERITGMSRSTLYLAISNGKFPRPVRVTEKSVAWLESEVAAWQASRIAARDGKIAA